MPQKHSRRHSLSHRNLLDNPTPSMIIVGDIDRWAAEGRATGDINDYTFVPFQNLTSDLISNLKPEIVLSPLIADDFDAADVVSKLNEIGFSGRYRVISGPIAKPQLISTELSLIAPSLDVDLVVLSKAMDYRDALAANRNS